MSSNADETKARVVPGTEGAHGHAGDAVTSSVPAEAVGDHGHGPAEHDTAHGHAGFPVETEAEEARRIPLYMYIAPLIIALIVLCLVWGPISGAFARYPGVGAPAETGAGTAEEHGGTGADSEGAVVPHEGTPAVMETLAAGTLVPGGPAGLEAGTVIPLPTEARTEVPTQVRILPTEAPVGTNTAVSGTPTTAPVTPTARTTPTVATSPTAGASPTTGASLPPGFGDTAAGALSSLEFGGQVFRVETSNLVPDWVFSREEGVASWVAGTVLNYLVGLPSGPANAALFDAARPGDRVRLTLAGGEVYTFEVAEVTRVDKDDTSVLQQEQPAVTLLLLGEPGDDRAMVRGHYLPSVAR